MEWDDGGEVECKTSDKAESFQEIHHYWKEDKPYTVTASYCSDD